MNNLASPLSMVARQAQTRVRLLRARNLGATGLLWGSAVAGVGVLLLRANVLPEDGWAWEWLFAPPVLGLLGGLTWGWTRRVDALSVLRHVEQKLELHERLSTAHLLQAKGNVSDPMQARQIADASERAGSVQVAKAFPLWPLPRRIWAAPVVSLAAFLLWFLPTLPAFQSPQKRAERAQVAKQGERLVKVARQLEREAAQKKLPQAQDAARKLAKLGEEMRRGNLSQQKALAKAAKLTEEIKRQQQEAAKQTEGNREKSLAEAARQLEKSANGQKAQSEGDKGKQNNPLTPPSSDPNKENQNKTGQQNKQTEAQKTAEQLKNALAKSDTASLSEQLSRLADQTQSGKPQSEAERVELSEKLEKLSQALQDTRLDSASQPLAEAAQALKDGDTAKASEKMREAGRKIAESAKKQADNKALQDMANALSPDSDSSESEETDSEGSEGDQADAFDKDGQLAKGHRHTAECLKPGGTCNAGSKPGAGNEGKSSNAVGTGAGTPGGKNKPATQQASAYAKVGNGKGENRKETQTANVRNDKFTRVTTDSLNATKVKGEIGANGKERISFSRGAPGGATASSPLFDVDSRYAPAVESALSRDDIPAPTKKQVKTYFDSLRQGGANAPER